MSFSYFEPDYHLKPERKFSNFPESEQKKFSPFDNPKFEEILPKPEQRKKYLPSFVNAYLLARISQLCYKSSVNAEKTDDNFKAAVQWALINSGISRDDAEKTMVLNSRKITKDEQGNYSSGTQGLIIFHQETAIIAFRGSEKKFNDWAYNAKIARTDFPYEIIAEGGNGDETIHRGFLEAFQAVVVESGEDKPKFGAILETLKEECKYIWLTGHSLGGAIAIIAASYLKQQNFDNIAGIYTFGAPRVGNDDYRNYINRIFNNKYWRFMHDHDIVPDLPPSHKFGGYSREGCMLRLKQRDDKSQYELLRIVNNRGERKRYGKRYDGYSASDHEIEEYANRLLELIKEENKDFSLQNEIEFSKDGKLLGENPEVLLLKADILKFFQNLMAQNKIQITLGGVATPLTLEKVAYHFDISLNILEIVNNFNLNSNDDGCDLRLMSVATKDELVEEGQSLVIVALVGKALHIRIFDVSGEKVVDKAESELIAGEALTQLRGRLDPFPEESNLSPMDKQEIIKYATSSVGHTHDDEQS